MSKIDAPAYNPDWPDEQKQAYADHMGDVAPVEDTATGSVGCTARGHVWQSYNQEYKTTCLICGTPKFEDAAVELPEKVREKFDAARKMISDLCKPRCVEGHRDWVMRIPAEPDYDPDLVIGDALQLLRDELLESLTREERLCGALSKLSEICQAGDKVELAAVITAASVYERNIALEKRLAEAYGLLRRVPYECVMTPQIGSEVAAFLSPGSEAR